MDANHSDSEWQVLAENGGLQIHRYREATHEPGNRPDFKPLVSGFGRAKAFATVADGWLVGFNDGEFGAALYWFNRDGTNRYKISDHQVVDFFFVSNRIYAVEGLAHMGSSEGSVIELRRSGSMRPWRAYVVADLQSAPYAVATKSDGTALITLDDAIVSFGRDQQVRILFRNAPWGILYPNSSVLLDAGQSLYVGMREFVVRFDLLSNEPRYFVPTEEEEPLTVRGSSSDACRSTGTDG